MIFLVLCYLLRPLAVFEKISENQFDVHLA
jgi:hypothetical protein